ncbi:HelD family protein [Umezawaea endophytica]|uniref:AAA family ATPase n=1 Tax=Umezawaea endophytica TaxID=1654476 RepID=A0A9X2VN15_9PSEU|nr:ATP-binding domain-containing protein [Umezawaea endophytica]MCS7479510.1 AAA family ATPase [Umezawaea endophytica]
MVVSAGEFEAERQRLRYARECLARDREEMLRSAKAMEARGDDPDLIAWLYRRAFQLEDRDDAPLFFGRIDGPLPEPVYIGRRHVGDGDDEPAVIDWRTGMATRFYRATGAEPMEVVRRRRFGFSDDTMTGYDDEHLTPEFDDGLSDFVRRQIELAHYGPMRDIVATIQPDQDHVVRRDATRALVVQGGPGTGKTAVGLHRAAYLLYEHQQIRRRGVLVVGPNDTFVHHISRVLPTLGEVDCRHVSVAGLVGAGRAAAEDPPVAALKGDRRLATVLHRAVWSEVGRPTEDFLVTDTSPYIRVHPEELEVLARDLLADRTAFGPARELMRDRVANRVRRKLELRGRAPSDTATRKLARSKQARGLVESIWPVLKPGDVLLRLYSDPEHLARCADGVLSPDEQRALVLAEPPARARRARWTAADHVLLDELAWLLDEQTRTGHVVLDEAQDLSAMQLRAVGRRCAGTLTLLGDLAQQTTAWGLPTWDDVLAELGHAGDVVTLDTSYRVPQQVLDIANRVLAHVAPDLPPTTSARSAQDAVTVLRADTDGVARVIAELVEGLPVEKGGVGVITADADAEPLRAALTAEGVEPVLPHELDRRRRLALVPAGEAKGLEFDTVVLVDPHRLLDQGEVGPRLLYVALTRAISHLAIVHTADLPDLLGLG